MEPKLTKYQKHITKIGSKPASPKVMKWKMFHSIYLYGEYTGSGGTHDYGLTGHVHRVGLLKIAMIHLKVQNNSYVVSNIILEGSRDNGPWNAQMDSNPSAIREGASNRIGQTVRAIQLRTRLQQRILTELELLQLRGEIALPVSTEGEEKPVPELEDIVFPEIQKVEVKTVPRKSLYDSFLSGIANLF